MGRKKTGRRERLVEEIESLLEELSEEDLSFLLRQAAVLVHNKKVDELNERMAFAESENPEAAKTRPERVHKVFFDRAGKRGHFFLQVGNARSIMDEAEVMALVRIAAKAPTQKAAADRLYRWFEENRDDILMESGLEKTGADMKALCLCLKSDFAIREG
jgi:flagellar motility protein MotE (MotC chaperone)